MRTRFARDSKAHKTPTLFLGLRPNPRANLTLDETLVIGFAPNFYFHKYNEAKNLFPAALYLFLDVRANFICVKPQNSLCAPRKFAETLP